MDLRISRKNLLKWAGFLAAGLALPKTVKAKVLAPREKPLPRLDSEAQLPAVCKLCPAHCMLQIRVVNGKPVGVSGMPGHPVNQGSLCPKGNAILQDLYHPDRLRSPLRQIGPRGSGRWEETSWEQALAILRERLADLRRRNRPQALGILTAPVRDLRHEMLRRFARAFGTPHFWEWSWPLGELPRDAFEAMHGDPQGLFYDLTNADYVVSFGWDWLQSFPSCVEAQRAYGELRRGRLEKRAKIVQIEPRLSITAGKADEWIAAKSGTEGVLALGVAHVLIREGLYDKAFISRWATGFEEFRELVLERYALDGVSDRTGILKPRIFRLAQEMASAKPALAITYRGSLFDQLAVHSLNVLLGSIGKEGGLLASETEKLSLRLPPLSLPEPGPRSPASADLIPETILGAATSPLEALWMVRVNPVFASPQPALWKRALEKIPFVASFSPFMDESSQWADLVLPPHHGLEAWQDGFTQTLQGEGVLSFSPPVLLPRHVTADPGDVLLALARGLGGPVAAAFPWGSFVEVLGEAASGSGAVTAMERGEWLERAGAKPGAGATLRNGSGKLRLPGRELLRERPETGDPAHPLGLYVHVPLAFSFAEGAHLPYLHSLAGPHLAEQWESWMEIHPLTARRLGVADGQKVWVESALGRIVARARHYPGIREDTVSIPMGLGHTAMGRYAEGIGVNPAEVLSREVGASGQVLWQGTRVRVYPCGLKGSADAAFC